MDALVFMFGIIVGILGFAEVYPGLYDFAWSGGRGAETLPQWLGAPTWAVVLLVAIVAFVLFWLAGAAEKKFSRSS